MTHEPGVLNHHLDRLLRVVLAESVEIDSDVGGAFLGLGLDQGLDVLKLGAGRRIGIRSQFLELAHDLAGLGNGSVDRFADRDERGLHGVVLPEQVVDDGGTVRQGRVARRVDGRAQPLPSPAVHVIASGAKQSPILRVEIASSLRSSQ